MFSAVCLWQRVISMCGEGVVIQTISFILIIKMPFIVAKKEDNYVIHMW